MYPQVLNLSVEDRVLLSYEKRFADSALRPVENRIDVTGGSFLVLGKD